jgi:hypothetical protein
LILLDDEDDDAGEDKPVVMATRRAGKLVTRILRRDAYRLYSTLLARTESLRVSPPLMPIHPHIDQTTDQQMERWSGRRWPTTKPANGQDDARGPSAEKDVE